MRQNIAIIDVLRNLKLLVVVKHLHIQIQFGYNPLVRLYIQLLDSSA